MSSVHQRPPALIGWKFCTNCSCRTAGRWNRTAQLISGWALQVNANLRCTSVLAITSLLDSGKYRLKFYPSAKNNLCFQVFNKNTLNFSGETIPIKCFRFVVNFKIWEAMSYTYYNITILHLYKNFKWLKLVTSL